MYNAYVCVYTFFPKIFLITSKLRIDGRMYKHIWGEVVGAGGGVGRDREALWDVLVHELERLRPPSSAVPAAARAGWTVECRCLQAGILKCILSRSQARDPVLMESPAWPEWTVLVPVHRSPVRYHQRVPPQCKLGSTRVIHQGSHAT